MFRLDPPAWHLKSTIGNIELITRFRRPPPENEPMPKAQELFNFWLEFFKDASLVQDEAGNSSKKGGDSKSSPEGGTCPSKLAVKFVLLFSLSLAPSIATAPLLCNK